jgi:hypothetical protein
MNNKESNPDKKSNKLNFGSLIFGLPILISAVLFLVLISRLHKNRSSNINTNS